MKPTLVEKQAAAYQDHVVKDVPSGGRRTHIAFRTASMETKGILDIYGKVKGAGYIVDPAESKTSATVRGHMIIWTKSKLKVQDSMYWAVSPGNNTFSLTKSVQSTARFNEATTKADLPELKYRSEPELIPVHDIRDMTIGKPSDQAVFIWSTETDISKMIPWFQKGYHLWMPENEWQNVKPKMGPMIVFGDHPVDKKPIMFYAGGFSANTFTELTEYTAKKARKFKRQKVIPSMRSGLVNVADSMAFFGTMEGEVLMDHDNRSFHIDRTAWDECREYYQGIRDEFVQSQVETALQEAGKNVQLPAGLKKFLQGQGYRDPKDKIPRFRKTVKMRKTLFRGTGDVKVTWSASVPAPPSGAPGCTDDEKKEDEKKERPVLVPAASSSSTEGKPETPSTE